MLGKSQKHCARQGKDAMGKILRLRPREGSIQLLITITDPNPSGQWTI
jgi:hypothetical protein